MRNIVTLTSDSRPAYAYPHFLTTTCLLKLSKDGIATILVNLDRLNLHLGNSHVPLSTDLLATDASSTWQSRQSLEIASSAHVIKHVLWPNRFLVPVLWLIQATPWRQNTVAGSLPNNRNGLSKSSCCLQKVCTNDRTSPTRVFCKPKENLEIGMTSFTRKIQGGLIQPCNFFHLADVPSAHGLSWILRYLEMLCCYTHACQIALQDIYAEFLQWLIQKYACCLSK